MGNLWKQIVGIGLVGGLFFHVGCGGDGPSPAGASRMPDISGKEGGTAGFLSAANSAPLLRFQTRPMYSSGDPHPVVTGTEPFELKFTLCNSSDADGGDSLNWQFHFGDDGSSPWNPDGTFNANVGQMCRTTHTYQREGTYTATVSVTDKHLDDQGGGVAGLARVSQQLTVVVQPPGAGAPSGGGAMGTLCRSGIGLAIPDNTPAGVSDSLGTSVAGTLSDLDVSIVATHTWVGDLVFTLQHVDTGTSATIFDRPGVPASGFGCSGNDINTVLNDAAGTSVENVCSAGTPAIDAGPYAPNNPLAVFNGESLAGTWRMSVSDNAGFDVGTLIEWCLIAS